MALRIYPSADPGAAFSIDEDFDNPLAHTFDGVAGAIIQKRYYVRNDDNLRSYQDIQVQPIHVNGLNIIDGTDGFSWRLIVGDEQPLEEQWSLVSPGNAISLADIGTPSVSDIVTFLPFWLRIEVPRGTPVQSFEGIKLRLSLTEILI